MIQTENNDPCPLRSRLYSGTNYITTVLADLYGELSHSDRLGETVIYNLLFDVASNQVFGVSTKGNS